MDLQDELEVEFINRYTNKLVKIDINKVIENSIIFSFNEYESVSVKLKSDKYNIRVECLCAKDIDNNYINPKGNLLNIGNNEKYTISICNSIDISYLPGKYQIIIYDKNKEINKCYFNVDYNRQVSKTGMYNVIEKINDLINGLSFNYFINNTINSFNIKEDINFKFYDILSEISLNISNIIYNIKKDFYTIFNNEIIKQKELHKQNYKTLKYNLSNFNGNYYNIKKVNSYNTNLNKILKSDLILIINILSNKKEEISTYYKTKEKELEEIDDIILNKTSLCNKTIDKKLKLKYQNHILAITKIRQEKSNWYNKVKSWYNSYIKVYNCLNELLHINQMDYVDNDIFNNNTYIQNSNYVYIHNMLYKLNHIDTSLKKNYACKRSYELFEIYGFIVLQNIFKELGYFTLNDINLSNFVSGCSYSYINKNRRIEIKYDYSCLKYTENISNNVVSINSYNCQPDYLILFYEDDTIKDIIVVEMKYRNLKKMLDYRRKALNHIEHSLEDYYQLAYKIDYQTRPLKLVRNVIVLYPSLNEFCFNKALGEYIGLNLDIDFKDSVSYKKLYNIISTYS